MVSPITPGPMAFYITSLHLYSSGCCPISFIWCVAFCRMGGSDIFWLNWISLLWEYSRLFLRTKSFWFTIFWWYYFLICGFSHEGFIKQAKKLVTLFIRAFFSKWLWCRCATSVLSIIICIIYNHGIAICPRVQQSRETIIIPTSSNEIQLEFHQFLVEELPPNT